MTPSRKKIVGAIASAVTALTLLGGTAASAANAAPRPAQKVTAEIGGSKFGSGTVTPSAWKAR